MALELPTSLSPSKVSSFTDCALSFRFSAIDKIPQPPTIATVKGTLVHAALERLLALDATERTIDAVTTLPIRVINKRSVPVVAGPVQVESYVASS